MSGARLDGTALQAIVDRSPYLTWLGLRILDAGPDSIEARATWREEWVANRELGQTQGGILATLLDFAADCALAGSVGRLVPTVDLRVDYHRMARKGDLIVKGRVLKAGKLVATCEAQVFDEAGQLLASGRGTFLSAPPPERTVRPEPAA